MANNTCAIEDCGYPTRWRDLCNAHAVRLHRTGERGGPVVRRGPKDTGQCSAEGCISRHYCGGYCTRHYQQISKRGLLNPPRIVGSEHHSWRGDLISYRTAHNRVESAQGPARDRDCVDCDGPARHWSYNHSDGNELVNDAGQPYSADPDHYSPRCVSCHFRFDRGLSDTHRIA